MALHICLTPRCGRLTTTARCPEHTHAQPRVDTPAVAEKREERRQRDGRDTTQWQRTRLQVLTRDGYQCSVDGCDARATHAHYIPRGHHTRDVDDYESMCATHHGALHGRRSAPRLGA